jgi:hypothetical protein
MEELQTWKGFSRHATWPCLLYATDVFSHLKYRGKPMSRGAFVAHNASFLSTGELFGGSEPSIRPRQQRGKRNEEIAPKGDARGWDSPRTIHRGRPPPRRPPATPKNKILSSSGLEAEGRTRPERDGTAGAYGGVARARTKSNSRCRPRSYARAPPWRHGAVRGGALGPGA